MFNVRTDAVRAITLVDDETERAVVVSMMLHLLAGTLFLQQQTLHSLRADFG
jgi:hypothetical protein